MQSSKILSLAMEAFTRQYYVICLDYLIQAYDTGENREEILDFVYSNFVNPNEEEFKASYKESSQGFSQVSYESLSLDFIPVAEEQYIIFDKIEKKFEGMIDCREEAVIPVDDMVDGFNGYIFGDIWDVRTILPYSMKNTYQVFYLLSSDINKSASFGKLPGFVERFMNNMVLFQDMEMFSSFFESYPDIYIPKQLIASESAEEIEQLIANLHQKRVEDVEQERNNILLSICIPSYNRGNRALMAVQNIQRSFYDSEIEIVVSSNCSTEKMAGYEQIKAMKDSRINYFESEKYLAFDENLVQVLRMARGRFVVVCSDEDLLLYEELPFYLQFLMEHPSIGILFSGGIGVNFPLEEYRTPHDLGERLDAMAFAMAKNYMTGTIYNKNYLEESHCLKKLEKYRISHYWIYAYPHLFINMLISHSAPVYYCTRKLWFAGDNEESYGYYENTIDSRNDEPSKKISDEKDETSEAAILLYPQTVEGRKEMFQDIIKIFCELIPCSSSELLRMYYIQSIQFFRLLAVAMFHHPEYFIENNIGKKDIWKQVLKICKEEIRIVRARLTDLETETLVLALEKYYDETVGVPV